ncbi:DgyrCDS9584 [Dimorphilus gyrociliatus]|uniref:DgyrCDS9584 n=1 Tax=Dimorphilus gyrociliatus TaxID=2664684 RepID=A0A7I8VXT1_9ANNE|nr:DgyrCDS9584 [Dimorphilus gyrociliatus]
MHRLLFFIAIGLRMLASAEWEDWSMSSEIRSNRRCIDIPSNMSLCKDLNYTQMVLPNLLDHETVPEAVSQSTIWLQLVDQNCFPHTRLFLCTLFAPLCFDPLVKPCRSLCEDTRRHCEPIMKKHRYSWPVILNCSKFEEKDPCVRAPKAAQKTTPTARIAVRPTDSIIKKMNNNSCGECEMNTKPSNRMICSSKFRKPFT